MRFSLVTLFPEFFDSPLASALLGKALESGVLQVERIDPRAFTQDRHRTVDDRPYGGGPGMVMLPEPLEKALASIDNPGRILLMAPSGRPLDQTLVRELAEEEALTLVCGRYEGVDARLAERFPLEPVSVGDFVLGGGEAAALCVLEAVGRLQHGFMGHADSGEEESFSNGLLEYPHYTRPEEYEGLRVPDILRSGDHGRIAAWRREQSLRLTLERRPDLLAGARLEKEDLEFLRRCFSSGVGRRLGRNLYLALVHYPVLDGQKKVVAVSLTNLDLHDIARCSRAYGLGGSFVLTPLEDQRALALELLGHWTSGPGRKTNPERGQALESIQVLPLLEDAVAMLRRSTGREPRVVATSARVAGSLTPDRMREWLEREPVLLLLGTGKGLAPQVIEAAHGTLGPIRPFSGYNHLPVRSAAAIYCDRILGDCW